MKKISGNKKTIALLVSIILISVISKYFQFNFLNYKYFVDSNKILDMINNLSIIHGLSYVVTANFFRFINIFSFDSLFEWSIFLTFIFNFYLFFYINKYKNFSVIELTYILISIAILNIFSFNLSKEIIQIIIFGLILYIIKKIKLTRMKKVILINIVLLLESIFFRNYYIFVLLGMDISYFVLMKFNNKSELKKILFVIVIFLICLFVSKTILPSSYNMLMNIRIINESNLADANTLIRNVLPSSNSNYFYINYIINFIRISFPLEIALKGAKYAIFSMYQITTVIYIFKRVKKGDILSLSVILGYYLSSVIFEPDFGSVIRHGSTLFLIVLYLIKMEVSDKNEQDC